MKRNRFAVLALAALLPLAACEYNTYPSAPTLETKPDTAVNLASQATLIPTYGNQREIPLLQAGLQWSTGYAACAPQGVIPLMQFKSSDETVVVILGSNAPELYPDATCPLGQVGWVQGLRFATLRVGGASVTRTLFANPKQSITEVYSIVPYNGKG